MAAICSRPRLALAAALWLFLLMPACSLVRPEQAAPPSGAEQAQRLVVAGKHAEAAQAYADLASRTPADRDNYELLSAEQWVLANNLDQARQAFAAVSPEARTTMPASRALVAAEIALAERDGAGAIRELDTIPVPTSPQLAQSYWWLRGKAAFLSGHPVEGTRAFVERERYIADRADPAGEPRGAARAASRRGSARRLAQGSAENRSARRRVARARTDRRRNDAQPHARRGDARRMEARIPAASRRRHAARSPGAKRGSSSADQFRRSDRAAPAAVGPLRKRGCRRARRIHRRVSPAGPGHSSAAAHLRRRGGIGGRRVPARRRRRRGVRGGPAHQGGCRRRGAGARRQDARSSRSIFSPTR